MRILKLFLSLMLLLVLPIYAQLFTGNGGAGRSIAILLPQAIGLTGEQQSILPTVVQGELVSNFSTYSEIKVLDRENLYEQYKELESGIYADNAVEAINDIGNLPVTEFIMMGRISKIGANYNLQFSVTKTADKTTVASFSENTTIEELNNLTTIRRASLHLLEKLGVILTAQSKTALSGAAESNRVDAQFANARGVIAQRQGTEVAALSYYFQASALDPSLFEAANRSSVMATNISSGNIGDDTRNKILWRRDWVARLTEAEKFFNNLFDNNSMPYVLFYAEKIIEGNINYQAETQELSIKTNLRPSSGVWTWLSSVEKALQAVYDGLDSTGMRREWGLQNWPWTGVTDLRPFEGKRNNFSIVAELIGNNNKVIGRTEFQSRGEWNFNRYGRPQISISEDDRKQVSFKSVSADDISDRITIRIASVNGINANTAAKTGVLQIKAISEIQWNSSIPFKIKGGEIVEYNGNGGDLVIPNIVWDEPVASIKAGILRYRGVSGLSIPNSITYIGDGVFADGQLTKVSIPNSVISIGKRAFANNRLTGVTIPNSVISIGESAFANNQLTGVTIPNSINIIGENVFANNQLTGVTIPENVISIGDKAFANNKIKSIIIGKNVNVNGSAFDNNFNRRYYQSSINLGISREAGTYYLESYKSESGQINYYWNLKMSNVERREKEAAEQAASNISGTGAISVPAMMNSVNDIYKPSGFLISLNGELFNAKSKFFRIGLNFDLGFLAYDMDAFEEKYNVEIIKEYTVEKTTQNGTTSSKKTESGITGNIKLDVFAKLYIAKPLYLSGGAGFGFYGGKTYKYCETENKDTISIREHAIFTAVFPVGAGIVFLPKSLASPFFETQYNIVPVGNRSAGYWSFNVGGRFERVRGTSKR
jgi:hypothetical protein